MFAIIPNKNSVLHLINFEHLRSICNSYKSKFTNAYVFYVNKCTSFSSTIRYTTNINFKPRAEKMLCLKSIEL